MAATDPQMQVRLPSDLMAWIEQQAQTNGCSKNSEIVRAVRQRMEAAQDGPQTHS
jgi:Arc/MetJ-type ribon-helix-helix transcriptional regulator